jgi:hypothetical protein
MPLWLIVALLVVCIVALTGVAGVLIDRSAERHDREQGR